MCGIFAVSGSRKTAGEDVLKGLKKLEYRGYDSWGIAIHSDQLGINNKQLGAILIEKEVGKISEAKIELPAATEAFGHSRWATHGGVTRANAHPHKVGRVALAHNGICENYLEIKKGFSNYEFKSETDSEVIAVLIDSQLPTGPLTEKDVSNAIRKASTQVVGRFAILVMVEGVEGIFAARRGSPLILGRGDDETFIASDIPAFLERTNIVNYLDDDEMVHIHEGEAVFSHLETGKIIEKRNIEVPWKVEEAEKGAFDHFMLKEIFEQKDTIARAINHDNEAFQKAAQLLNETNGAYFVSCGTAHKVAMVAEYFFADISKRKINVVAASEMPSFEKFVNEKTAIIAISQSGETADVLEILERGKKKGAKILAITNVETSSVARLADVHLPICAGVEKAVASTKAATAQMAVCFLLAHADAAIREQKQSGTISSEIVVAQSINEGREILRTTASSINDMLNPRYEEYVKEVAEKIVDRSSLFIIGRGNLYPIALEASIKIQEVSYINAVGFAAGELKHGPIALIENRVPCLVLGDDPETISNAMELKARGARIIGIAPTNVAVFDEWLKVPDCDGAQAIASIIPVQILAYHLALLKGLDPDMPRNLAKSVTVK